MRILFAASEASPFVKVGGLGDVAGALPKALVKEGHEVAVVLPFYSVISEKMKKKCKFVCNMTFRCSWRTCECGIFSATISGVTYYLIDNPQYFHRNSVYGEFDDGERFGFFSMAVLELLQKVDFFPDVIHANDWHTALVPVYLDTLYRQTPGYEKIRTLFSIHNIEFQGKYDPYILGSIFGLDEKHLPLLTHDGMLNLMKGAIESSNLVTTVSKRYAKEILDPYFSFGLHTILQPRSYKLHGIVNGIDVSVFNPKTDKQIAQNYSSKEPEGKLANKLALQEKVGLPINGDIPVVGMVTRLTPQKGVELFFPVLSEILQQDLQLVILGTGFPEYEHYFKSFEGYFPEKIRVINAFDAALAQQIYAGADLFLMPSKSEPCGLAQMIAMRYGTIPIVHAVGGLADTVTPFQPDTLSGNGITFQSYNAHDMADAIRRGLALANDPVALAAAKKNAMTTDFSWKKSAKEYISLYEQLV